MKTLERIAIIWSDYIKYRAEPQVDNKSISALKRGGSLMSKPKMTYFKDEDILHLIISDEKESNSVELSPNITAELNESGELIGIEILEASSFIRDSILEAAQAKMLNFPKPHNYPPAADAG
jgi:uncharacterized protein YuzE